MANIVILGAGVMGSALACVAAANNDVTLVGSPLDKLIITEIKQGNAHPGLRHTLPSTITTTADGDLRDDTMQNADVIVIGVSSPGVNWALLTLGQHKATPNILALVTKGLVSTSNISAAPQTYAQFLEPTLTKPAGGIVGIGGPCIARELALGYPTRVCFAAHDINVANSLRDILSTNYYHIATHTDFTGLEACAALKNFMCIGVSAMFSTYSLDDNYAKNPVAALFNQAVHEIANLCHWIKQETSNNIINKTPSKQMRDALAFDLAGMGDLHVTVGGGRNSLLGKHLGKGKLLNEIRSNEMRDVTVEGVDTGKQLLPGFRNACNQGTLTTSDFPLTNSILNVIENEQAFEFNFSLLPG